MADKSSLKRIGIESLATGMYVSGFSAAEDAEPVMLMNNVRITSDADADTLRGKGYKYVFIIDEGVAGGEARPKPPEHGALRKRFDLTEAEPAAIAELTEAVAAPSEMVDRAPFDEEIRRATVVKAEAHGMVSRFMQSARSGAAIDRAKAEGAVTSLIDSMLSNQDALISLTRLKDRDNYTYGHSVNVCIISLALGRRLGFSRAELDMLGLGAMLHDIGKMRVSDEILGKPGFLTEVEYAEMKNHVAYGALILERSSNISPDAIVIATQHHERYDGTGYPKGLSGERIHPFGRMVAIADAYDAITTERPYNNGRCPTDALRRMYGAKGSHFDPIMMDKFITSIGIYPIGSHVRLDNGLVAEVKSVNRGDFLRPVVTAIYDADTLRLGETFDIDLATARERSISSAIGLTPVLGAAGPGLVV